jgi:hypothetical protein
MENIIKFYELNEIDLLNFNQSTVNQLYEIITDAKRKLYNDNWLNKSCAIIEECTEVFAIMNLGHIYYIDDYIIKLKKCIPDNADKTTLDNDHKYIARKVKLLIQLLEYLKIINYDGTVFFDACKYNLVVSTYNIFYGFKDDIKNSYVELYSNNYIFYYSLSGTNTNICIYYLDDLYDYKIFVTLKKNNFTGKIKLCIFDVIIKTERDFYNKIEQAGNYKLRFVDITQIAKCFSINSEDVTKEYQEANFINQTKMLEYVNIFLND